MAAEHPTDRLPTPVVHLICWPSLALGVAATLRPSRVASAVGLDPTLSSRAIRIAGWRELIILAGFLVRPTRRSLWWFVGQDACDLTAAAVVLATRPDLVHSRKGFRLGLIGYAILAVGDITAVLVWGSRPAHRGIDRR